MAILNDETAIKYAKDLTITAMEHNMIPVSTEASETAKYIFEFYKTLYEELSGKTPE